MAGKQLSLDDYLDNLYHHPPYGYAMTDAAAEWFDRGGFSIQPNLLAGLLPHLDRDEPELYLWMFFNAWAACYREETNALVEHPMPVLGYSNAVPFKTSDQANAMKWLRYLLVYAPADGLFLGRAVPRAWWRDGATTDLRGAATRYGTVSVRFTSAAASGRLTAALDLALRAAPPRLVLRFRHPTGTAIRAVTVNGAPWPAAKVDAAKGDVDLSGASGSVVVEARYE